MVKVIGFCGSLRSGATSEKALKLADLHRIIGLSNLSRSVFNSAHHA
jgi:hypothetical protein